MLFNTKMMAIAALLFLVSCGSPSVSPSLSAEAEITLVPKPTSSPSVSATVVIPPTEKPIESSIPIDPLFINSIVSTDIDFILETDPNAFTDMNFLFQDRREMPDKRFDELFDEETFVFELHFDDDQTLEVWAHSSFGSVEEAEQVVLMVTGPLGKLPGFMRNKLDHVVIHKGDETAFAESEGHFFMLYSENMKTRISNHDLEETVFHESVHATLDSTYLADSNWLTAQEADAAFITTYAADNPNKEDLAESAIFAYVMLNHPGRLPAEVEQWINENMANRLGFFQTVFP